MGSMPEKLNFLQETTIELLKVLGFTAEVNAVEKDGAVLVTVSGEGLGILIGYHGETLLAMQTWLGLSYYQKFGEWGEIKLDISGYAQEREERLRDIAVNACDRARFLDKPIELAPMSAYERRFIHTIVSETPGMASESVGEGFDRRVIVSVKRD